MNSPSCTRAAIASATSRGEVIICRYAGNTCFQHQLRAVTGAAPVAAIAASATSVVTAASVATSATPVIAAATAASVAATTSRVTAAATAAPAVAGAGTDIRPYPCEDGLVLRHTGRSALSTTREADPAVAGEMRPKSHSRRGWARRQ